MIASVLFIIFVGSAEASRWGWLRCFLTVMGIIPRLMQLTKTMRFVQAYEAAVILGAVCGDGDASYEPSFNKMDCRTGRVAGRCVCRDACGRPYRGFKCPADFGKTNRAQK